MKFYCLLVPVLVFGLAACSHDSDNNSGAAAPKKTEDMKDITDTSACHGTSPANISVYRTWRQSTASANFKVDTQLQIGRNSLIFSNTCTASNGMSADVSVTVPATVDGNVIQILQEGKNSTTTHAGENSVTCDIDLKPMKLNYNFSGNCLSVTVDQKTTLLVP